MTYDKNHALYVDLDGNFGYTEDLMFVNTSTWTEEDFDEFDNWLDGQRWDFVATGKAATVRPTEHRWEVVS
jgi:hypothetical protein